MKYCQRKELTLGSPFESWSGESWVKSEPRTKGPGCASRTADPPAAQVPVLAGEAVAVGKENAGPTPQMTFPGWAGVKKVCSWISPKPLELVVGLVGMELIGTMVREMRVKVGVMWMGMTGWKLRLKKVWS